MPSADPYNLSLFEDDKFARANETIAFQVKDGRLTLVIRRLFHFILYCTHNDGIQEVYRRPLQEVLAQIQYNSDNLDALKERFREMRQMSIEWNVDDRKESRWGTSGLLSTVEIVIPRTGSGWSMVEWSLAPFVRDRVVNTSTYTELSLRIHTQLRGNASVGLYEICSRYKNMPNHMTPARPWQWWWAQVNGEPESAMPAKMEYRYFHRDTLKKAILEVNEISDIEVELLTHKSGKSIDKLQFIVKRKGAATSVPAPANDSLLTELTDMGMSARDARSLLEENTPDLLRKTIALVNARAADASQPKLRSKAAYFKEALRGRYAEVEEAAAAQSTRDAAQPAEKPAKEPMETRVQRLRDQLEVQRIARADELFKAMDADEMLELVGEFKRETPVPMFKRASLANTAMRKAMLAWLAIRHWGPLTDEEVAHAAREAVPEV
jgi:hypothetical protein